MAELDTFHEHHSIGALIQRKKGGDYILCAGIYFYLTRIMRDYSDLNTSQCIPLVPELTNSSEVSQQ